MPNHSLHKKYIKHGWVIGMLLFTAPVLAEAPSQDFWEYMVDFDDGSGDMLDPLEYDQLANIKNDVVADASAGGAHHDSDEKFDNPKIRNADMKMNTQSSAQASSVKMKGATL